MSIADGIYHEMPEAQYAAPKLLRKMVADKWLRRKTGQGFYDY